MLHLSIFVSSLQFLPLQFLSLQFCKLEVQKNKGRPMSYSVDFIRSLSRRIENCDQKFWKKTVTLNFVFFREISKSTH